MTRNWRQPLLRGLVATIAFFLVAPTLVVVPMSFSSGSRLEFPPPGFSTRWYENFFSDPRWTVAAMDSLQVALLTTLFATVLGTLTALGLVRSRFRGRGLVTGLVLSPMIVPLVIIGIGTFFVFSRWQLAGTLPGLVFAHTVLALPLVVVTVGTSLRAVDRTLETAAQSLGAGPWRTFRRITLPLILPGVVAGALFAFVTSWDEIVVSLFITTPLLRTLPVEMWSQVRTQIDPTVAAVATLVMVVTTLSVFAALLVRRRGGAWR